MTSFRLACGLWLLTAWCGCKQEAAPATSPAPAAPAAESIDLGAPASAPAAPSPAPETPAVPATPPAAAAPAASTAPATAGSVDLRHVADDTALAVIVRPAQALNNPVVMGVIHAIEEVQPNFKLSERLDEMRNEVGADANDIDHVLVVVDQQQLAMATTLGAMFMGGPPPGAEFGPGPPVPFDGSAPAPEPAPNEQGSNCDDAPPTGAVDPAGEALPPGGGMELPPPVVVFRFKQAIDPLKLANAGGVSAEQKTHAGKTYFSKGNNSVWFSDPQTAVLAAESKVQSLMDGKYGTAGALAARLEPLAGREFALVLDVKPLHSFIGVVAESNPIAAMAGGLVKQVNLLTLAADLQGSNLLQLQLHTLNDSSAGGLQGMLGGFLQQGQQAFEGWKTQGGAELGELLPLTEKLVHGSSVTAEGAVCSITIPRPEGVEQLPQLIKPALQKMQAAAASANEMNSLRQIAIAFHMYHDLYRQFPAHGGPGSDDRPGTGLSWRVHLLPLIEEGALYNEFHLDEPWDSEHNKMLIARMPAVYGSHPEGKTAIHLFVGPGTPFDGTKGIRIQDVTDGTSNTLLMVQAGPSTAEVWTKPGGLTPDAASPLGVLGDVGETFLVTFMDGSARKLPRAIEGETFQRLVNPADGQPVEIP